MLFRSPILASEHGKDVDHFILIVHYLMAALFVGWLAYFLYALFRFRKSANPKADYTGAKGTLANNAEIAVAAFFVFIIRRAATHPLPSETLSSAEPFKA